MVFDLGPSSLSQRAKLHSASLYGIDLSHSEPIRVFYYSNYRGQEESVAEESVEPRQGISPRGGLKGKRQRKKGLSPVFGLVSFLAHSLFFLGFSI